MASFKNVLNDISSSSGQLKSALSFQEKSQINSIKNLSGSISSTAGKINGDVTKALNNVDNTIRGALDIGSSVASSLENAGLTQKNAGSLISSVVSGAVNNKTSFARFVPKNPVDLSNPKNRLPFNNIKQPFEKIQSKTEKLVGRLDENYYGYSYPSDSALDYPHTKMQLHFMEYIKPEAFDAANIGSNLKIYLPMPDNYDEQSSISYAAEDTGIKGLLAQTDAAEKLFSNLAEGEYSKAIDSAKSDIENAIKRADKDPSGSLRDVADIARYIGQSSLTGADPILGGLSGQFFKEIPNPHASIFFKGLELRSFTFSWKFTPLSKGDALILQKILKAIKKRVLPTASTGFMQYPYMVQPTILFKGEESDKLGQFKKSMIRNIGINYTAEGTSQFFYDGNPVSVQLTLNLQEIEYLLSNDIEES